MKQAALRAAAIAATWAWAQVALAQVTVADPWVRGTVEGQTATAAYLTLHSSADTRLVTVSSPVATRCSLHEMSISGNLMRMRSLESLPLAAGATVELKQGGTHIMLEGLTHALKKDETVRLNLTFVDARGRRQRIDVVASVVALGAPPPSHPAAR